MLVSELIEMLLKLDPDMPVMMEVGENIISVCKESSVENIPLMPMDMPIEEVDELTEEDMERFEKVSALILIPCSCSVDILDSDEIEEHFPGGDIDSVERLN